MRLDIINYNGLKIINDAYNASPQSMEAAIDVLKDISGEGRTFAVLGDMLELGNSLKVLIWKWEICCFKRDRLYCGRGRVQK